MCNIAVMSQGMHNSALPMGVCVREQACLSECAFGDAPPQAGLRSKSSGISRMLPTHSARLYAEATSHMLDWQR